MQRTLLKNCFRYKDFGRKIVTWFKILDQIICIQIFNAAPRKCYINFFLARNNAKDHTTNMSLFQYLSSADFAMREELSLKAAILAEKFAPDLSW